MASTDIQVFGCTYLFTMLLLIGLTLFFIPRVFLFSIVYKREDLRISVSLLRVKQVMFYNQVKQLIIACKTNQTTVLLTVKQAIFTCMYINLW